jgi:hypothetical protein
MEAPCFIIFEADTLLIVLDQSIPDDILSKHIDLRKPRICPICKSTYYGKRTICSDECKKKSMVLKCTIPPVSKSDLQRLIDSNTPFTTIGKQYGVSDNAVRKWCKKYNIDSTKQSVIDENKLTELVTTGRGIKYISRELKATPERLYKIIDKLGLTVVDNRPKQISIELVNRVKELIDEGKRNTDIIPLVGLDQQQVSAIRCKYKKKGYNMHNLKVGDWVRIKDESILVKNQKLIFKINFIDKYSNCQGIDGDNEYANIKYLEIYIGLIHILAFL